jgi:hypothetical protein
MGTAQQAPDRKGKYEGQYVALDPSNSDRVIASGPESNRVAAEARRAGVKVPVIIYVPSKDSTYLY